jgi:hypothetical protein
MPGRCSAMSKAIYDELVAAGAPELPPSYFWRISGPDRYDNIHTMYFDLRQKTRFGSYSVVRDRLFHDGRRVDLSEWVKVGSDEALVEVVTLLLQEIYGAWRHTHYEADQAARLKRFIGDHP